MGKLTTFDVTFSLTPAVYDAGTRVKGMVTVVLAEPMHMRNLRIWLHGRAKVHWTKSSGSGSNSHTKHYREEEVYIDETIVVFGSLHGGTVELTAGRHIYNFDQEIPLNAPSSFEGEYGYVRYLCTATIDRPYKFDHEVRTAFTVINPLDLNAEGLYISAAQNDSGVEEVTCCCCSMGSVSATFRINKKGYVPGENITIYAEINNNSSSSMDYTKVHVKQYVDFYARHDTLFGTGDLKQKSETTVVAEMHQPKIEAGKTYIWEDYNLRIPALPPSQLVGCSIINIHYVIKFYVGSWDTIKLAHDIVIGSIPLRYDHQSQEDIVTSQPLPSAPQLTTIIDAPPMYEAPPPTYEECVKGQRNITEDNDSAGCNQLQWAPSYPTYNCPPVNTTNARAAPAIGWNAEVTTGTEENRV